MQRFEAFFIPALLPDPFKTRKIQNRYFPQKGFSRENKSNMFYKKIAEDYPPSAQVLQLSPHGT